MSTVSALSILAKDSTGSALDVSAHPATVAVGALLMIAAFVFFWQFGEVFAHAAQLICIAVRAILSASVLVGLIVVMVVVAVRA
ncbi:hypothetical protein SAMN05421812_106116 [Asanoa hainanensis]|uniref:Uncharacterized protein n=1 Tax=Asanoa hainanensis TaxID=560556 RepID=A0A239MP89_9ACTN|nr:hypothetical protein [Asanoa hainanensis]SNT44485.1 hypothetical protein SAMN05421812_106116 [Asanoa hainanensis]